jgi:hypothetical protein
MRAETLAMLEEVSFSFQRISTVPSHSPASVDMVALVAVAVWDVVDDSVVPPALTEAGEASDGNERAGCGDLHAWAPKRCGGGLPDAGRAHRAVASTFGGLLFLPRVWRCTRGSPPPRTCARAQL